MINAFLPLTKESQVTARTSRHALLTFPYANRKKPTSKSGQRTCKTQGTHDWTSRVVIALGISCLRQLEVRPSGKTHIGYYLALDARSERNETL